MTQINTTIEEVKAWCKANDIAIYYSNLEKELRNKIIWNNDSFENLGPPDFLKALKATETRILSVSVIRNNLTDLMDDLKVYGRKLPSDQKRTFDHSFDLVKSHSNELVSLRMFFFEKGLCYEYNLYANWIDDYFKIQEAESSENEIETVPEHNYKDIDYKEVEVIARKINQDFKYINTDSPAYRREIANAICVQEGFENRFTQSIISNKAEAIYQGETKPKKEADIKLKIHKLRSQGLKKVQIQSQLGISQSILDKF